MDVSNVVHLGPCKDVMLTLAAPSLKKKKGFTHTHSSTYLFFMVALELSRRRSTVKRCLTVRADHSSPFDIEISVHEPPRSFRATDIETTFPDAVRFRHQPLFCIVTFQIADVIFGSHFDRPEHCGDDTSEVRCKEERCEPSTFSMISSDDRTIGYKDVARERFFYFMRLLKAACEKVVNPDGAATGPSTFWMDWTDPATGLPILGTCGPSTYCESDALEQLMACDIVVVAGNGGACRMINHERWGVDVYPASGFISVPSFDVLEQAVGILLESSSVEESFQEQSKSD